MSYKCICGKEFNQSNKLGEHKKNCEEIRIAVENSPFCYCSEKLGFIIHNGVLKYRSNCGKSECKSEQARIHFTGTKWTEEHRKNNNKTKLKEHIYIEGNFKCDRCNREFKSNTSLRSHKSSCGNYEGKIFECSECHKIFKKESGLTVHFQSKHNDNWEPRERMRQNGLNLWKDGVKRRSVSKLESDFGKTYLKNVENLKKQYRLNTENTVYVYDFYIKDLNLIIEVDGDYWHINPIKFEYDKMPQYIKDYKKREKEKQSYAEEHSYIIIRFWEYDIIHSPQKIKEELDKWLKLLN